MKLRIYLVVALLLGFLPVAHATTPEQLDDFAVVLDAAYEQAIAEGRRSDFEEFFWQQVGEVLSRPQFADVDAADLEAAFRRNQTNLFLIAVKPDETARQPGSSVCVVPFQKDQWDKAPQYVLYGFLGRTVLRRPDEKENILRLKRTGLKTRCRST